jgi:hypothetical protein
VSAEDHRKAMTTNQNQMQVWGNKRKPKNKIENTAIVTKTGETKLKLDMPTQQFKRQPHYSPLKHKVNPDAKPRPKRSRATGVGKGRWIRSKKILPDPPFNSTEKRSASGEDGGSKPKKPRTL